MSRDAHPSHRSWRQRTFDEYVRNEVIPFIHSHCQGTVPISTMGASLGGYHAANTLFRYPHLVKRCYALSGIYDLRSRMNGYDDNFYFHNPVDYLANLNEVTKYVRGEGGYLVMSDGSMVNVSRSRKEGLMKWF